MPKTLQSSNANQTIDAIVVGTGPGGATVAKTLAEAGQSVVMLEWGDAAPLRGELLQMARIAALPGKGAFVHADLSLVLRGITAGGSSAINFATMMAPPLPMFDQYGIDLRSHVLALRAQVPINTLPDYLLGPMAARIYAGARSAGLDWQKLEKFIHIDKCRASCHRCSYGCPFDAKWTAREFIDAAVSHGGEMLTGAKVGRVLHQDGRAQGVEYQKDGVSHKLYADKVVLAAGGIGSPRILQNSGFDRAGRNYFVDPVIAVMGAVDDLKSDSAGKEVPMAAGVHLPEQGITLSDLTLPGPMYQAFAAQVGRFDRLLAHQKTLSVMVKIKDDLGGTIGPKWINKSLSSDDRARLDTGTAMARDVLQAAGANKIFQSHHFAAHPGGGAKIGDLLDENLQTDVRGLYVCDGSVIPEPWGIAPSFTLMCLGHRLGGHLVSV
ncbi:MAG: GMC family oxidoreductase N-terminal domain-containing protein [Pseudomonadales bacterium]|nr:GMC family oxidoreductase N-terminal domain-containing protein [Pseudomonadales bacterium]NRA14766.1 GMC family oxidoreductase [Oceanospirillaceae bacterium]